MFESLLAGANAASWVCTLPPNLDADSNRCGKDVTRIPLEGYVVQEMMMEFDWLFFLMDFIHQRNKECELKLRENTVQALRNIGW